MDVETLQQKTTYNRRENSKLQDLQNHEGGRECVWNTSRFRVLLGTMEQRPKVVRDIVLTCVVLHNMLRAQQGGANRAPTTANDVVAQQNEQVVYVSEDNYWNPMREAKHQRELLKDFFNHLGALAGEENRI